MNLVVVAAVLKHHIVTSDGQYFGGWGGTMDGVVAALSCLTGPQDTVRLVARVGDTDLPSFVQYVQKRYGPQFDCSWLVPDPLGTNHHDAVFQGEGESVHIKRRVEPIHESDLLPAIGSDTNAVIFNYGDLDNYEASLIPMLKRTYPRLFLFVDVHRMVDDMDETGEVFRSGWPEWPDVLPYADAVQMNRAECGALLGKKIDNLAEAESAAHTVMDRGVPRVLLTLGGDGCIVGIDHLVRRIPMMKYGRIVDISGAGDALGVGFVVAYVGGRSALEAARYGSAMAAVTCSKLGYPVPGDVDMDMLDTVIEEAGRHW